MEGSAMFGIAAGYIIIPQFLYYIFLFGSGSLCLIFAGMTIYTAVRKKPKSQVFCWSIALTAEIILLVSALSGKVVGHMMIGG